MNLTGQRLAGLLLVLALHGAALYGLWRARLIPVPADAPTLFVSFITPPEEKKAPEPQRPPEPKPQPKPKAIELPQPPQLVAQAPVTAPTDHVAAAPPVKPEPVQTPVNVAPAPVVAAPLPAGPVALSSELSVACPQRAEPRYSDLSRRMGEEGAVLLRVELSETGEVTNPQVERSSGFVRLDNAALAAVRKWHCTPPTHNGKPVRATALQPFRFEIQGN